MRDTTQLHPALQLKLLKFVLECEQNGLKIKITECLRTTEEQDALYAQGRTTPGPIVTNARGCDYGSMHQWGVAADVIRNDGRNPYDNTDGFFDKCGLIGMSCGLEWGGSWNGFRDRPHYQLPDWGSNPYRLKLLYGNPENFFMSWIKKEPVDIEALKAIASLGGNTLAEDKERKALLAIANLPKYRVISKDGLKLRKEPNAKAAIVKVMPFNAKFVGSKKKKGKWIYGDYKGNKGWANSNYLTQV